MDLLGHGPLGDGPLGHGPLGHCPLGYGPDWSWTSWPWTWVVMDLLPIGLLVDIEGPGQNEHYRTPKLSRI